MGDTAGGGGGESQKRSSNKWLEGDTREQYSSSLATAASFPFQGAS